MKKTILISILALGITAMASAQPRSIGLRLGYGVEASYEHTLGENFIEAELGWSKNMFDIAGIYNFIVASPNWTEGEWNVYCGPGATIGGAGGYGFMLGIVGQVGLEYNFNIPLQLSLDIRPQFNIPFSDVQCNCWASQFGYSWIPALSVRYRF